MAKQNGTETTSISFRQDVIEALEEYCQRQDVSRSDVVNQAVKLFLLIQEERSELWKDYKRRRLNNS